jgi:2-polyprenyl-6-methoxyphenol hydroxylase-like FAD-dependent oxidoreductase
MMDVVICGAGPTGLLLAGELALAGVRPVVLEKRLEGSVIPRANGLIGQPVRLLELRGLLGRFPPAVRAPTFPFGDVPMDLSLIPDTELPGLLVPQPSLERLLAERAAELGATVLRGHELVGLDQDSDGVTLEVRGPNGPYELSARYVVGCDGGHSVVGSWRPSDFLARPIPRCYGWATSRCPAPQACTQMSGWRCQVSGASNEAGTVRRVALRWRCLCSPEC